ncbi:four-helix bundle copper-binding protein [Ochrobactrum teleogrylli]
MLKSPIHNELCRLCARICDDCAESCRALDGMEECVAACQRCAASCREMANHPVE